jgi:hypothetical protein
MFGTAMWREQLTQLVLGLAGRLMKHFFAAQVAAEHVQFR